jgi:hypothetical protein
MRQKELLRPTLKEYHIMKYLWRWKVATTAAITARFYPDYHWDTVTTYWKLWRLKKRGLVTIVQTNLAREYVWALTTAGFKVLLPDMPSLKEKGFASENVTHDLMVQAAHIGDYLPRGSAPQVGFFTEQELRRVELSNYPEWVPETLIHRPDGYWNVPDGNARKVIALEVELSSKTIDDYGRVADFYNNTHTIDEVLWIVQSRAIAEKIQKGAKSGVFSFRDIHQYVSAEDFKNHGWQASIFLGKLRGRKISEFLDRTSSNKATTTPQPSSIPGWSSVILDTALKRVKPTSYQQIETLKNHLLYVSQLENAVSQTD